MARADIEDALSKAKEHATAEQRDANRSLHPQIQERMQAGYTTALAVPRGKGTFNRMKDTMQAPTLTLILTLTGTLTLKAAMHDKAGESLSTMFSQACQVQPRTCSRC